VSRQGTSSSSNTATFPNTNIDQRNGFLKFSAGPGHSHLDVDLSNIERRRHSLPFISQKASRISTSAATSQAKGKEWAKFEMFIYALCRAKDYHPRSTATRIRFVKNAGARQPRYARELMTSLYASG
jgi:hypothetical protein